MKTKNFILNYAVLLILFSCSLQLMSQNGQRKQFIKDKIETQKIAYITNALSLTSAEAQQFWPVYNEFNDKNEELLKTFRKNNIDERFVDPEKISDKEALDMADDQIIQAQRILDLRKKYHIEFKKVLPPKKLLKLYQAEKDFKKFLLKEIKDRRDDRMKR
jgi:hypothetical protein